MKQTDKTGTSSERTPKISLIIPVHNAEKLIAWTLFHAVAARPDQIVVVDDASTDDTVLSACIALRGVKIPNVVYKNRKNGGPLYSLIVGQGIASHDVIMQCDGDGDWLDHNTVDLMRKEFEDEDVWVAGGRISRVLHGEVTPHTTRLPELDDPHWFYRTRGSRQFHPRTWRKWLFAKIPPEELYHPDTKELWRYASDPAILHPMLEMAGPKHIRWLDKTLYYHNWDNPLHMRWDPEVKKTRDYYVATMRRLKPLMHVAGPDSVPRRHVTKVRSILEKDDDHEVFVSVDAPNNDRYRRL